MRRHKVESNANVGHTHNTPPLPEQRSTATEPLSQCALAISPPVETSSEACRHPFVLGNGSACGLSLYCDVGYYPSVGNTNPYNTTCTYKPAVDDVVLDIPPASGQEFTLLPYTYYFVPFYASTSYCMLQGPGRT